MCFQTLAIRCAWTQDVLISRRLVNLMLVKGILETVNPLFATKQVWWLECKFPLDPNELI